MEDQTTETTDTPAAEDAPRWARVEIMGHRTHWGRVTEIEQFGTKMLRIDVPDSDAPDAPMVSHEYAGSALFGITWTDEATARRQNKKWSPAQRYLPPPPADEEDDPFDLSEPEAIEG